MRAARMITESAWARMIWIIARGSTIKRCATDRAESADADIEMASRKAFPAITTTGPSLEKTD